MRKELFPALALLAGLIAGCDTSTAGMFAPAAQQPSKEGSRSAIDPDAKPAPAAQKPGAWVALKGQVILPKALPLPAARPLNVTTDKEHCLSKGALNAEDLIVDPKSRGVKNVWVYLRPDSTDRDAKFDAGQIAPALAKPAAKTHDVDQPCCAFIPRIFAIRAGDSVNFKNSSPVAHNTKLDADPPSPSFNKTIAPQGNYKDPAPFAAQRSPVTFSCSIHPWMGGKFMVFDHPYFAVTDADGKFEIKDCPAGKFRIIYRHENGFHKGREGNMGWPVEIKAGADAMALEPLEIEIPESK